MQPISRRAFLVSAAVVVVTGCSDSAHNSVSTFTPASGGTDGGTTPGTTASPTTAEAPAAALPGDPFTLGVASGDPDATGVVLWTRLAPDPLNGGGMPAGDIDVLWEVSASPKFADVASSGIAAAPADHGHAVHVVAALEPGDWYYRFRVGEYTSPTGVTRRAPAPGDAVEGARFAAASCQNYADGQYTAHGDIAEQRPDFLVWLGDYIYESAGADGAELAAHLHLFPEPTEHISYLNRYARFKTDPHLQTSHSACP